MHIPTIFTRRSVRLAASLAAIAATALPVVALSQAAGASPTLPTPAYNCIAVGADTGCGYIITVNGNGTASVSGKLQGPYDHQEDVLIGIVNDSDALVTSINVSGTNIMGFDGDGLCSGDYTFSPASSGAYCAGLPTYSKSAHPQVKDPYDYEGPNNTFVVTSKSQGTVDFTTPLIPAQATFFSLEQAPFSVGTVGLARDIAVSASPVTATEGISSGPVTVATFTDGAGGPSPDSSPTSDFSASITWGDGTTSAGTISGGSGSPYVVTGTHTYTEEGPYTTSVKVSDNLIALNTGTAGSTATVADAPLTGGTLTLGPGVEGVTDGTVSFNFTDANPYATTADFTSGGGSTSINWGDGTISAGTVSESSGVFNVAGSHLYTEEGNYTVGVSVADDGGSTTSAGGTLSVGDAPLTAGTLTTVPGVEGVTDGTVSFSFTDANPYATTADFTSGGGSTSINWGDGTNSAGTVGEIAGVFYVTGSHLYTEEDTYTVGVSVTDDGGSTTSESGSLFVADAPLTAGTLTTVPGVEGVTDGTVSFSFTDANPYATTADFTSGGGSTSINWGDGTSSAGTVGEIAGVFYVTGSHLYTEEDTYTVGVSVADDGGSTTSAGGTLSVGDAPLTAGTLTTVPGVEGVTDGTVSFSFTDANPYATTADFTSGGGSTSINWGDGNSSAGTVGEIAGVFYVTGSHLYTEEDTYTVGVSVTDDGGSTASGGGKLVVADAPLTPTATQPMIGNLTTGHSFTAPIATFTDANPAAPVSDFAGGAQVNWGDGSSSSGVPISLLSQPGGGSPTTFEVVGTHTYASNGTYTITVSGVQDVGGATLATITNTVNDYDSVIACGSTCSGTATNNLQSTSATSTSTTGTILMDLNNTPSVGAFSCGDVFRHAPQYSTVLDNGLTAGGSISLTITFNNKLAAGSWIDPFAVCYDSPGVPFTDLFGHSVTLGLLPLCPPPRKGQSVVGPCVQSITYSTILPLPSESGTVTESLLLPPNDPFVH